MNILNAIGNIGKDASIRYTPNGDAVAGFSFALTSGYGDKAITTWLNCSIWGKRAETLAPMLTKGTKIGLTGELTNRPYNKDGVEKYSLDLRVNDVTLLGKKSDGVTGSNDEHVTPQRQDMQTNDPMDFSEDVPF
jgi:single-strand DNA-binding protein